MRLLGEVPDSDDAARLGVDARIGALQVAWRAGGSAEKAERLMEEGLALARQLGDRRLEIHLRLPYAVCLAGLKGDEAGRFTQSGQAIETAKALVDAELDLEARVVFASSLWSQGRMGEGLEAVDGVVSNPPDDLTLGSTYWNFHAFGFLLALRGLFQCGIGKIEVGRKDLARALELARSFGTLEGLGMTHCFFALAEEWAGSPKAALGHARAALEAARRYGANGHIALTLLFLGRTHLLLR